MKLKLFTEAGSPSCAAARAVCKSVGTFLEYDISTEEGKGEVLMHGVTEVPTIIIADDYDNEVKSWRGMIPVGSEIKSTLEIEL